MVAGQNVWIFGLRRDDAFPACARLLDLIGSFSVLIPLQVLKELNLALTQDEVRDFYRLVNQYSEFIELSWEPVAPEQVESYEERGCRKGDAVIAAHAEVSGVRTVISENRQFLQTLLDLPIERLLLMKLQPVCQDSLLIRLRLTQLPFLH